MARRRFTLRSSHLLMWSSPLLLLVLVFTLNSRPLHQVSPTTGSSGDSSTSSTTNASTPTGQHRSTAPSTTTTTTTATSKTAPDSTTTALSVLRPPTLTTTSSPRIVTTTAPLTTTTTARPSTSTTTLGHSSVGTTTSVVASAPVDEERFAGNLTLVSPAAVLPLRGPGQWTLRANESFSAALQCGSRSSVVTNVVNVAMGQTCTLEITIATGAPTAWTLVAVR